MQNNLSHFYKNPMLSIHNASLIHEWQPILQGISHVFSVGSCTAIIGNNGAWKTSLIKAIIGQIQIKKWHINLSTKHIGYCPDTVSGYEKLTPQERRTMTQKITKSRYNIDQEIQMIGINTYKDIPLYKLSQGNRQKANIINSLCHNPSIYIRDEPTQHLDPESRYAVHQIMQNKKQENKTIIYTTHFLEDIGNHTDSYIIMEQGSIWKTDTNKEQSHLKQFFYTKNIK